jgi:small subunit ribosomal protein S10
MRSFLGPAKRIKITHAARPFSTTTARSDAEDAASHKTMATLMADVEAGNLPLDEQLEKMGLDPVEYKELWNSQKKAQKATAKREPKTREEAQKLWKQMQSTPDDLTLLRMYKRGGVEPIQLAKERGIKLPNEKEPLDPKTQAALDELRQPLNVRAVNMRPLRREPQYGVPVCDLQLRTYSIQNLTLFADFAVRAAYYMGLVARGPIPLPRITERWTVPRDVFIFKKSQENFERITMRRLIQIQDGHPDVVKAWLAFLTEHQMHGVGMKANIWEYEDLEAATRAGETIQPDDKSRRREGPMMAKVDEILNSKGFKEAMKGYKAPEEIDFRR